MAKLVFLCPYIHECGHGFPFLWMYSHLSWLKRTLFFRLPFPWKKNMLTSSKKNMSPFFPEKKRSYTFATGLNVDDTSLSRCVRDCWKIVPLPYINKGSFFIFKKGPHTLTREVVHLLTHSLSNLWTWMVTAYYAIVQYNHCVINITFLLLNVNTVHPFINGPNVRHTTLQVHI